MKQIEQLGKTRAPSGFMAIGGLYENAITMHKANVCIAGEGQGEGTSRRKHNRKIAIVKHHYSLGARRGLFGLKYKGLAAPEDYCASVRPAARVEYNVEKYTMGNVWLLEVVQQGPDLELVDEIDLNRANKGSRYKLGACLTGQGK